MDRSEDLHPQVRIAEALEYIAYLLEKMADPPMMVRGNCEGKEFTIAENLSIVKNTDKL